MIGPCLCGDLYCPSCGPAQGAHPCDHGKIYGDCEVVGCWAHPDGSGQPPLDPFPMEDPPEDLVDGKL